ncbi:peptidoglycan DD-metalloendopeptidase family protein [Demetria terragena]|uniref:peptidoglycan DD-metalloendopeptidase family protein n=1 Tax=Demetria terragena TaxID=63959 RepID=UPI00036CDF03|nr:peptidoglycan DD-metalloendopeptidase family protein [Demetria terragena]
MRTIKNRTATALGVLALGATSFTGVALAGSAQAADRDGKCDSGEFCYNFNSDLKGSWSDFKSSVGDYGTNAKTCYEFKGAGAGKSKCIKNEAGGYWNNTSKSVTVYFNSGYAGESVTLKPGAKGKLPAAVYNNNASHKIGGSTTPPSNGKKAMSQALYEGGGGTLTAAFDGYKNTPGRHEGIDFAKGFGSKVKSLVDGTVINADDDPNGLGTLAIYMPKEDKTVIYLHANTTVKKDAKVKRGDVIATEANRQGGATHTHVEMRPGKHTLASKSVNDPTLDNPDPTSFWNAQGYVEK